MDYTLIMAVGDIVIAVHDVTAGTPIYFQPAVGVEIMISFMEGEQADSRMGAYNGSINVNTIAGSAIFNGKCFINNTTYLRLGSAAGICTMAYSGIQIK
jgi:hypothetical protein